MTTAPTPGRPLTDDQREVLWTAAAQHAWRGVTTAPEALFDAVERIKADAYQQGRTDAAANVATAMRELCDTSNSADLRISRAMIALGDRGPELLAALAADRAADSTPSEDQS